MAKDIEKKSKKENKHFFKDFKAELKKVIWPTPRQVVNNTVAVITIVLITAVIVFALDLLFKAINTYGINSIKNLVRNESTTETTENVQTDVNAVDNEIDAEITTTEGTENQENVVKDAQNEVVESNNVQE